MILFKKYLQPIKINKTFNGTKDLFEYIFGYITFTLLLYDSPVEKTNCQTTADFRVVSPSLYYLHGDSDFLGLNVHKTRQKQDKKVVLSRLSKSLQEIRVYQAYKKEINGYINNFLFPLLMRLQGRCQYAVNIFIINRKMEKAFK